MDPNYRASEEQWAKIKEYGRDPHFTGASCILELRARIEALEAAQQPDQITYEPRWHMLSEEEPQIGDHCIYQFHPSQLHQLDTYPSLLHTYGAWRDESTEHIYRKGFWAPCSGLFVGDPRRISWRLAMPHEIPPQQPADHIAGASKMVSPPAPAGELVERVKLIIAKTVAGEKFAVVEPESWNGEARAAIREVAAWLSEHTDDDAAAYWAARLDQEANR
jgi:hypothetical protein